MNLIRALRHLFSPPWLLRRAFPPAALERIEAAIEVSEASHRGEICFAVEGRLEFLAVLRGLTPRECALEVFSVFRVWDTAENSGVLIYLQLVDHDIEIVADRGLSAGISQPQWDEICETIQTAFKAGRYEAGAQEGLARVSDLLARHFPAGPENRDELPDRPAVLQADGLISGNPLLRARHTAGRIWTDSGYPFGVE